MSYIDYNNDFLLALSNRTGIVLIGTKSADQDHPYAQVSEIRGGNQQSTGGVDFPTGSVSLTGMFKSRREGERWTEWIRKSFLSTPVDTPKALYRFTSISSRTRPDITTASSLWRSVIILKFERIS